MLGMQTLNKLLHKAPNTFIDALVSNGIIKPNEVDQLQGRSNSEIEKIVLLNKRADEEKIGKIYAAYLGFPYVKITSKPIAAEVLKLIPEEVAKTYTIIPFELANNVLSLAVGEPSRLQFQAPSVIQELNKIKDVTISIYITSPADIEWGLKQYVQAANVAVHEYGTALSIPETGKATKSGLPYVDLMTMNIPYEVLAKFPKEVAEKYKMVAFGVEPPLNVSPIPKKIKLALLDSANPQVRDILEFIKKRNGMAIEEYECSKEGLAKAIAGYSLPKSEPKKEEPIAELKGGEKEGAQVMEKPVIKSEPVAHKPEIAKTPEIKEIKDVHHIEGEKEIVHPAQKEVKDIIAKPESEQPGAILKAINAEIKEEAKKPEEKVSVQQPPKHEDILKSHVIDAEASLPKTMQVSKPENVQQPPLKPKIPELSPQEKLKTMTSVAGTVLKPAEERVKEGITQPYSMVQDKKMPQDEVRIRPKLSAQAPEIKAEDIQVQDNMIVPEEEAAAQNLEESDLDKFLSEPVDSVADLERIIKVGMIPEIVAAVISLGVGLEVSDVHIESSKENVRIRYRMDGMLKDVIKLPVAFHAPLISRIKILAKLKIDEQRIPQDGRFNVNVRGHEIDLRISTLPTVHGEKIVMRILDKSTGMLTLEDLGVTGRGFDVLARNITKPYGIILATGPTGSGKSTTLYAVLQKVSQPTVNIITLEDPVEYEIPGINQTQVKPQIGFTFAEGLRSVLRQDPNIIMVGEIRDLETASMATHAALTGHLVLSTLHTNDSAGALPRLINMGVEPFLITSSVNCILAQRLVRKICPHCRQEDDLPAAVLEDIKKELTKLKDAKIAEADIEELKFFRGKGCDACTIGYHGRIGIFEVLPMSDKIEELAVEKSPANVILAQALKEGMITMRQDGILKALKGITTIDEVMRVTQND